MAMKDDIGLFSTPSPEAQGNKPMGMVDDVGLFKTPSNQAKETPPPTMVQPQVSPGILDRAKAFLDEIGNSAVSEAGGPLDIPDVVQPPANLPLAVSHAPVTPAHISVLEGATDLNQQKSTLDAQANQLANLKAQIEGYPLDGTSQASVDAYNTLINQYGTKASGYTTQVADFNQKVKGLNLDALHLTLPAAVPSHTPYGTVPRGMIVTTGPDHHLVPMTTTMGPEHRNLPSAQELGFGQELSPAQPESIWNAPLERAMNDNSDQTKNALVTGLAALDHRTESNVLNNYEDLRQKIVDQPTVRSIAKNAMTAGLIIGGVVNPLQAIAGLAGFTGLDWAERQEFSGGAGKVNDYIVEMPQADTLSGAMGATGTWKDIIDLGDMLAKGALVGGVTANLFGGIDAIKTGFKTSAVSNIKDNVADFFKAAGRPDATAAQEAGSFVDYVIDKNGGLKNLSTNDIKNSVLDELRTRYEQAKQSGQGKIEAPQQGLPAYVGPDTPAPPPGGNDGAPHSPIQPTPILPTFFDDAKEGLDAGAITPAALAQFTNTYAASPVADPSSVTHLQAFVNAYQAKVNQTPALIIRDVQQQGLDPDTANQQIIDRVAAIPLPGEASPGPNPDQGMQAISENWKIQSQKPDQRAATLAPAPAPTVAKETVAPRPKSPYTILKGWFDPKKWAASGLPLENLPLGMRKNGAHGPDEFDELVNAGVFPPRPENMDPRDYAHEIVKRAVRKEAVTFDQIKYEADNKYDEELQRRYAADPRTAELSEEADRAAGEIVAGLKGEETAHTLVTDPNFVSEDEYALNPTKYLERQSQAPATNELFDTSGAFSLSGNQPVRQASFTPPEKRPERLLDVEKADTNELYDRKHPSISELKAEDQAPEPETIQTKGTDTGTILFRKEAVQPLFRTASDLSTPSARLTYPPAPKFTANAVTKMLEPVTSKLPNIGTVKVVDSLAELPAHYQRAIKEGDKVFGAWDPRTDTTYILARSINDVQSAKVVLLHEVIGHRGIEAILPDIQRRLIFKQLSEAYGDSERGKQIIKDYGLDLTKHADRDVFSRELIAHLAESGEKPSLWARIVAAIRMALRRLINLPYTMADIKGLIHKSYEWSRKTAETTKEAEGQTGEPSFLLAGHNAEKASSMPSKEGPGKSAETRPVAKPEGGKETIVLPRKEYVPNTSSEYVEYRTKARVILDDYRKATEPLFEKQDAAEKNKDWDTVFKIRKQVDGYVEEREKRLAALGKRVPDHIVKVHYDTYSTNGIKNYDLTKKSDAQALLEHLLRLDGNIGVRGIYKDEIGKKNLRPSSVWEDHVRTKQKLKGTSVMWVGETSDLGTVDDLQKLIKAENYGDSGITAIVFSKESPVTETIGDDGEAVFPDAKVIGYIDAPTRHPDLPNPSRSPGEGEQTALSFRKQSSSPLANDHGAVNVGSIADVLRDLHDYVTIEAVPRLTRYGAADAAVEHASARIALPRMVDDLLSKVFPHDYHNPAEMSRFIDLLNKDNIIDGWYAFVDRAKQAIADGDIDAAQKWMEKADKVEDNYDIADLDRQVRVGMFDPKMADALNRWKDHVVPLLNRLYNEVKRVDPNTPRESRGRYTEARINLLTKQKADVWNAVMSDQDKPMPEGSSSSYRNPNTKHDSYDTTASFTGDYSTDARAVLANVLGPRWNETTKIRFYDDLVDKGVAIEAKPGEETPEGYKRLPVKMPHTSKEGHTSQKETTLFVKADAVREVRDILNTDQPMTQNAVGKFLTGVQLAQVSDLLTHLHNIMAVLSKAQGSGAWKDVARRMPILSSLDAVKRVLWVTREVIHDTPEMRAELADMAKKGLVRPSYPATGISRVTRGQQVIHEVDTATRVIMNRFFDNLVQQGLAKNTEANRRRFINQVGQYNRRLMGPFMRLMAQSGLSPFIVAGRNFNRQGRWAFTGNPGVKGATWGTALHLRLVALMGVAMLFTLPIMLNMLTTGQPGGRSGTPLGAWDLGGKEDEKGKHRTLDLLQLTGVRRGMRSIGAEAAIEGYRQGHTLDQIAGQARQDALSAAAHPWIGPGLGFLSKAVTGKQFDLRGDMKTNNQYLPSTNMWFMENLRAALEAQNPLVYSMVRPAFQKAGLDIRPDSLPQNTYLHSPYLTEMGSTFLKSPFGAIGLRDLYEGRTAAELATAGYRGMDTPKESTVADETRGQVSHQLTVQLRQAKTTAERQQALSDIAQAEAAKQIIPSDRKRIVLNAYAPLISGFKGLTYEQAQEVYKLANPNERSALAPLLAVKMLGHAKEGYAIK